MTKNILHFILSASTSALLLTLPACDDDGGGGGAKDVCEQSGEVLIQDCGLEPDDGGGSGGQAAACEGDAAAGAQCIVDNPDEACAFFDALATDPTNLPDNAYTQCVAMISG